MKDIGELREVKFNYKVITYTLMRKKVKNINLRIKEDKTIVVSASRNVPVSYIDDVVLSKGSFILNTLEKFDKRIQYNVEDKKYITGEKYRILGKTYNLELVETKDCPQGVTLNNESIILRVREGTNLRSKEIIMDKWFREQRELIFKDVSDEIYRSLSKYGVPYAEIKIRKLKSTWGSCKPRRGIITLNSKLFYAPIECIEYVVLHEYAHFIHPNHSKEFHNFVESIMPDWKERKHKLEYND